MGTKPIAVLVIEDNAGDARLIQELLSDVRRGFQIQRVDRLSAGLECLSHDTPDVVLLDLGLPDSEGLQALSAIQKESNHVPVVVLTGLDDEEMANLAVREGAQDYLVKGQVDGNRLGRVITYAIERKQLDETLRDRDRALQVTLRELEQRNQELDSFTYIVSHDLKEPLRTVESFGQFLMEDHADRLDEQGRDYLTRMGKAAGRMKQMIEDLLVLSRLSRPPDVLLPVNMRQTISDITAAFQAALQERRGRIDVEGELPEVLGDTSRVEQIFGNLIANGLKFSKEQPAVTIGVSDVTAAKATFFVRDNGIGIDAQYHDKIFDVFQRLHRREDYEGTGAGLAIVKRAAQALHGRVWVESEPGAGATFFVSLPLWKTDAVAA